MKKPTQKTLHRACDAYILETLKYRAIFNSSLSFYQLGTFLLCSQPIDAKTLRARLKSLVNAKKIKAKKGYYYYPLVKKQPFSWHLRTKNAQDILQNGHFVFSFLRAIKWIKFLGVSGSVAAFNAKKEDDLDIFIITEANRLWLTRFFVVMLLKTTGVYRKICPNIYIDETVLTWPQKNQNAYTAHEIVMLQPIINRDNAYFRFLKANDWVFIYFSNFLVNFPARFKRPAKYNSRLIDKLEFFVMVLQLAYMRRKQTTEIVAKNFIHFNKVDHSEKVLQQVNG